MAEQGGPGLALPAVYAGELTPSGHVSRQHLDRYVTEFEFRYNNRKIGDQERAKKAVEGTGGKGLVYKETVRQS
jgi:hypothetical protein